MTVQTLTSPSGLWFERTRHGAVRRAGRGDDLLGLFVGSEAEGAHANLWLRVGGELHALLGPRARSRAGSLRWRVGLRLAAAAPAWFWHVELQNHGREPVTAQLLQVQDIALAAHGAVRLNEHYVSHYVDLQPLAHATQGWVVAARQNLAQGGRHPWALLGSLRRATGYATDGRQWRDLHAPLPSTRLQHEHAGIALEDAPVTLQPGARVTLGFWGRLEADHPAASGEADLAWVDHTLALPEAAPAFDAAPSAEPSLFARAGWLGVQDLDAAELDELFGAERRHEERIGAAPAAFFTPDGRHVVLRAKEHAVLRPHGHLLRGGRALVPDESALTSTVWMAGVFHSMLTQGHVSTNRFLSTVRGYLGQFRSQGLRLFVRADGGWKQLGVPSAFEIGPDACRWFYRHAGGLLVVESRVDGLQLQVRRGRSVDVLASLHVALGGDDGAAPALPRVLREGDAVLIAPPPGSEMARRFPAGSFALVPQHGTRLDAVGGDERLYADGRSRGEPFVCLESAALRHFALRIEGRCIPATVPAAEPLRAPRLESADERVAQLDTLLPWFQHNALVHYLAPRGLEQYSGGGWGTRDVCQGPLEMLLGSAETEPVRDLLVRTFSNQNADGDWPQWFMFFDRDRAVRAGDSHGDIVFWPLLALARYLRASGDAALLDERVPFFGGETATVWQHAERALALIARRTIPGTRLAAYGHGDWNDALQPADPALRERLCSAWTVTLHHQVLTTLADALQSLGRGVQPLRDEAAAVAADFNRLLVKDGVIAGYARFPAGGAPQPEQWLLHPGDTTTGLRYSLLPLMHAVLEDMLEPALAREQLDRVRQHCMGPDGARLFDAPLAYRGGPERLFQRAESSAYFGREIGVMYTHAHLRWAETLAHVGDAPGFFAALMLAVPAGLAARVPAAAPRQANCYYSSSDAAFADRYQAQREYQRVLDGTVALEGGWRVYSSGPGILLGLVWRHVVGVELLHDQVVLDPVLPPSLDGLVVHARIAGRDFEISYRVGPAGCGPREVTLNGRALGFTRRPSLHRRGAARVPRAAFDAACTNDVNRLELSIA